MSLCGSGNLELACLLSTFVTNARIFLGRGQEDHENLWCSRWRCCRSAAASGRKYHSPCWPCPGTAIPCTFAAVMTSYPLLSRFTCPRSMILPSGFLIFRQEGPLLLPSPVRPVYPGCHWSNRPLPSDRLDLGRVRTQTPRNLDSQGPWTCRDPPGLSHSHTWEDRRGSTSNLITV